MSEGYGRAGTRSGLAVALLALLVAGCAVEPPESSRAAIDTTGTAAPAALLDAGAALTAASTTPTTEWSERRALAALDSVFPHSPHRAVECSRCHVRPASHVTHTGAECTACHHRPAILATLPEPTARECAQCHHEQNAGRACTSCHERDGVGPRPVLLAIETAGGDEARVRSLTFSHTIHAEEACRACHTQPVTRRFAGDCSICHTSHHRQEARCITCHDASGLAAHAGPVHEGCAGGGCHASSTVLALQPTRNVCLACHTDLTEHRPGRECVACHASPLTTLGEGGGGR